MKPLPKLVRRLPYLFYAFAVVFAAWRFYNEWTSASLSFQYAQDVGPIGPLAKSTALYSGLTDAFYMLANGAVIHVLIAIYDKVRSQ